MMKDKDVPNQPIRKWACLMFFIVQNAALIVALRYSAIAAVPDQPVISTTEVLFTEILKLVFSMIMCFAVDCNWNTSSFLEEVRIGFVEEDADILKLCVPAVLYTVQNNLQYVIETGTLFLILYQFKIITTALFFSVMLSRRVSLREWFCILALALGVSIVESSQSEIQVHHASNIVGIFSVVVAILTSGFAGVYFEKILKSSKSSIWMLNAQLSLLSCVFGTITCMTQNWEDIGRQGWFYGYTPFTVLVIVLQATVGLVVALVVKYTDNIHKGYATSISIVLSIILDPFQVNDVKVRTSFLMGAFLVCVSFVAYVYVTTRFRLPPKGQWTCKAVWLSIIASLLSPAPLHSHGGGNSDFGSETSEESLESNSRVAGGSIFDVIVGEDGGCSHDSHDGNSVAQSILTTGHGGNINNTGSSNEEKLVNRQLYNSGVATAAMTSSGNVSSTSFGSQLNITNNGASSSLLSSSAAPGGHLFHNPNSHHSYSTSLGKYRQSSNSNFNSVVGQGDESDIRDSPSKKDIRSSGTWSGFRMFS